MPKRRRLGLHERLAAWSASDGPTAGSDEIVGTHLELAFNYRLELGPRDEAALDVGRTASRHLAAAGRRALDSGFAGAAAGLLKRATALLDLHDPGRLAILADHSDACWERGDLVGAQSVSRELRDLAAAAGREDMRQRAQLQLIAVDFGLGAGPTELGERARATLAYFKQHGGDRELGIAWRVLGETHMLAGRFEEARFAHVQAIKHLERAGDLRGASLSRMDVAGIDLDGPATMAIAHKSAADLRDWSRDAGLAWAEASGIAYLARLAAMRGHHGEARQLLDEAIAIEQGLDRPLHLAADIPRWTARVEEAAGNLTATERALRSGYEQLNALGELSWANFMAIDLARILCLQRQYEEARGIVRLVSPTDGGPHTQMAWHLVEALLLARDGRHTDALALGGPAFEAVDATDVVHARASARETMAEVLSLCDRADEARTMLSQALALYEHKGATAFADRVRARLATHDVDAANPRMDSETTSGSSAV
jgi:tetratricopeptide (TPR) repeat protein